MLCTCLNPQSYHWFLCFMVLSSWCAVRQEEAPDQQEAPGEQQEASDQQQEAPDQDPVVGRSKRHVPLDLELWCFPRGPH
uniref:Uncharacterized protein n=1 Tax=Knipowitschia caucasica TaxID=637954 RepID=A0AAV2KUZ4_KNICA